MNNLNNWKDAIIHEKIREEMILEGVKCGKTFLDNKCDPSSNYIDQNAS